MLGGHVAGSDQDITGALGGINGRGEREAVTLIAFRLGRFSKPPEIVLSPEKKHLNWPRHPVLWVPSDRLIKNTGAPQRRQVYRVDGDVRVKMETDNKGGFKEIIASNISIPYAIGSMIEKAFGYIIKAEAPGQPVSQWRIRDVAPMP